MTFHDFVPMLWRNLVVVLLIAGLTMLFAFRAATAAPSYQARYVITLLQPSAPFPRNSYASFTPDLVFMGEVAATLLSSGAGHQKVRQAGGTAPYQIVLVNRGSEQYPIRDQPYLALSATSPDSAQAQRTLMTLLQVLESEIRNRQLEAGALPGSLISWRVTKSTSDPIPLTGQPTRELLGIAILGTIGTVYAAVLADRFGLRIRLPRRRRKGARGARLSPRGAGV
jgi:hypothetical protein